MPATELSVAQLRQEAKKSIGQVLTPKDALRSDEQQKLSDAFYKYQQGASFLSYAINLPEVKQAPKSSEIHKKVASLQTQLSSDYLPRSSYIETRLKELEGAQNQQPHNAMQKDGQASPTGPKPGASIAERMRSLQDAGMLVSVPTRLSRDVHGVDSGEPSRRPESTTTASSQHGEALHGATSSGMTSLTSAAARNDATDSASTFAVAAGEDPSRDEGSLHPNSSPTFSSGQGIHVNATPGPSASQQDLWNDLHFVTSADKFSSIYPSIDELNARDDWSLPPAPLDDPRLNELPRVSSSKSAVRPDDPQAPGQSSVPSEELMNGALSDALHQPLVQNNRTLASPFGLNSQTLPPPATKQSQNPNSRGSKLPEPPASSLISPQALAEWVKACHKVLILDVRTREKFENERLPMDAIVCIEPSILMRPSLSSHRLEAALVISPANEQVIFENRDKFDVVVIMDEESAGVPSTPSPLSALIQTVYGMEVKKVLKRPPVILAGGLKSWKHDIGTTAKGHRLTPAEGAPAIAQVGSQTEERTQRPAPDPKRDPTEISNQPGSAPTSRRLFDGPTPVQSTMPAIPSALVSPPPPIYYPRPASTTVPTTSGTFPEDLRHSINNTAILTPPPASFPNSSGGRRRNDFVERWQPPLAARIARPGAIDYPVLSPHILPKPPAAVSSGSDRQERISLQPFPKSTPTPPSLLIPSNYPVETWGDVEIGISGLKNLGNTCYMNSTLQCLSATVPFVRFFQDGRWKTAVNMMNPLGSKGHVARNFATMVSEMWRQEYTYLSPLTFRKGFCLRAPQFEGPNQHDAQEFLSSLLDDLHEDLNRILQNPAPPVITAEREAELERLPPHVAGSQEWAMYRMRNDSLIVDYFQGQFRNRLQCMTCHHTSTTYNAFMYLSLPLAPSRGSQGTLYQCLDAFVGEEIMDRGNAWKCPHCQALRRATKKLSLSRLPPVLLIQLKRFSVNGPFTDKLETSIDYPVRGLDLTSYVPSLLPDTALECDLPRDDSRRQEPPFIYDLYAVTNHFGTLSTGHYTAYVASKRRWLLCDDSRVSAVDERDIVGRPAYILYYKRRGRTPR